ncbi:MAG: hypothetical protein AB1483_10155 [Candidatus Zixiibacteriota bacterium]
MNKKILVIAVIALMAPLCAAGGVKRIDVSPMVLINLSETQDLASGNRFLGGAVAGDFYVSQNFAIRTTLGYVKNLYNTSVQSIDELFGDPQFVEGTEYSFRVSIAPYAEAHIGPGLKPYATFTGGFGYFERSNNVSDIRYIQEGAISNAQYLSNSPGGSYYDLSTSLGLKVPVSGRVSAFAEVTHRIFSSFDSDNYYDANSNLRMIPFGFDQYKTFLSAGLTYSFSLDGN